MKLDPAAADAIAADWFGASGAQPGAAYGIVAGGELVHSGGLGAARDGGPVPDSGTVFRIASMTKSFTAALVLTLRDAGRLALDDAAAGYVPELAGVALPGGDCPPVTIRHLLTMTAGFPTDDPWGDRQQGLDPAEFARMLARGDIRCAWAPGTRFEYSNLGYALLGRVITAVTGEDYAAAARNRILAPLHMDSTGYEAGGFEPARLAAGHRRDGARWAELAPDGYGAFAPMGGVFSTVADLARWVAGFAGAFPPGGADARPHPLSRAARREMQLAQVGVPAGGDGIVLRPAGPARLSYGLGLFCEDDPARGEIVQHSGGYPGFGSNMRWHPATGLGVIVLANGTYAPAGQLARRLLDALLAAEAAGARPAAGCRAAGPAPAPGGPWPETLKARDAAEQLLQDWDDELAGTLLAPNVGQDQPLAGRKADIATLRERIGPFSRDDTRPAECDSPARCRWWLTGPGGTVAVQIALAPLRRPLVQQLSFAVPPAPASPLGHALAELTALMAAGADRWPASVPAAAGLDTAAVLRQLRVAAAWAGPVTLDSYAGGDGASAVTARLAGTTGHAELSLAADGAGLLTSAEVALGG